MELPGDPEYVVEISLEGGAHRVELVADRILCGEVPFDLDQEVTDAGAFAADREKRLSIPASL